MNHAADGGKDWSLDRQFSLRNVLTHQPIALDMNRPKAFNGSMFISSINYPERWQSLLSSHPIFSESMAWIRDYAATATEGIHELGKPGWFVNVHGYSTAGPESCVWENHSRTVDLQYIIEGVEGIDVAEVGLLGQPTIVKPESDTEKFSPLEGHATRLILESGMFAILMPGEAHRPKVAIGPSTPIRKLVVKIPVDLLR
ncbi:MAG: YhcH/YjgK/YiaL family protein [Chthoniobacterales bacterium]